MQFAVIGLGKFGETVAKTLVKNNCEVLAIDKDEERIQDISAEVSHAVATDALDEKSLRALITPDFDAVIICIGEDFEASILSLMIVLDIGIKKVIVKAENKIRAKILTKLGASQVIFPEIEVGEKLAQNIINPDIQDLLNLSDKFSIAEINMPRDVVNKTILESDFRKKYKLNIIAIRKGDLSKENIEVNPNPETVLQQTDRLFVLGETERIRKIK